MNASEPLSILSKNTAEIISLDLLKKKLSTGKSLTVKLGVDPSAPDIHLGHTVVLKKLKDFQDLGHKVHFLIGDFTAKIGDPSGKSKTRPQLTDEEIKENIHSYQKQVLRILDKDKTIIVYNSSWYNEMSFNDILSLASKYTLARLLERDDFSKRYRENTPISMIELLYPLIQGYDSVKMKADIEIGGTDQTFNLLVGRDLQKEYGQESQVVITMPILEGLDGKKKMSKSLNNYIGVEDSAKEMFGKIMSIPDELIVRYFELLTPKNNIEIQEIAQKMEQGENPKNYKVELAYNLIEEYHSLEEAKKSEQEFKTIFSDGGIPSDIPVIEIKEEKKTLLDIVVSTAHFSSKGEIRRLAQGGGVKLDNESIKDVNTEITFSDEHILKLGKRVFFKIIKT